MTCKYSELVASLWDLTRYKPPPQMWVTPLSALPLILVYESVSLTTIRRSVFDGVRGMRILMLVALSGLYVLGRALEKYQGAHHQY